MSQFKHLAALAGGIITSLSVGCSAIYSSVDKIEPVYLHGQDVSTAKTPSGFVVTVDEIREVVPLTKYAWNIYADSENYYLSSAIQKFTSKTGDNSWMAKENGIRISGTDRRDIEQLKKLPSSNRTGRVWEPSALREALNQER